MFFTGFENTRGQSRSCLTVVYSFSDLWKWLFSAFSDQRRFIIRANMFSVAFIFQLSNFSVQLVLASKKILTNLYKKIFNPVNFSQCHTLLRVFLNFDSVTNLWPFSESLVSIPTKVRNFWLTGSYAEFWAWLYQRPYFCSWIAFWRVCMIW